MPEGRPSIRDIIKNGQFTTRDLGAIPEDKERPDSSTTISSDFSEHSAREGDVILMPLDLGIQDLEPDLYLTGTPSIVTYTVGRGYSSVRMREINLPHRRLPRIEEDVSAVDFDEDTHQEKNGMPFIAPPPDFVPVYPEDHGNAGDLSSPTHTDATYVQSPRTPHETNANGLHDAEGRSPSSRWPLNSPNANMPPQYSLNSPQSPDERYGMATGGVSWPQQRVTRRTQSGNIEQQVLSPYSDMFGGASTLQNSPASNEFGDLKSRFSWADFDDAKRKHWFQRWLHDGWLLELACLFFGAAFMVAICLLGWRFDGEEIPEAWPFGVSLNAIIAILAAFARISLFFPTAEVLGQLKWYLSNRHAKVEDLEITGDGPLESIKLLARTKRM